MARTIDQIQQSMLDAIGIDPVLSTVATSTSKVAIYRLFTRIVATCAWTVEVLFDTLRDELTTLIATLKPHSTRWYALKALDFQYGYNLATDSDKYDNSALTEEEIAESKVIKYVAVTENPDGKLRIKAVTEEDGDLAPLSTPVKSAFTEYMARVKDAGVRLQIDSLPADKLKLTLKIYYDPLILNSDGQRLDGLDSEPVQNAVKNYLKNLPFNGTFVLAYLTDALQQVDGVVIPHIEQALTAYGLFPFTTVNVMYLPDSGYLRFEEDEDLSIEFIPQSQIL